jgi:hypothetical protein
MDKFEILISKSEIIFKFLKSKGSKRHPSNRQLFGTFENLDFEFV